MFNKAMTGGACQADGQQSGVNQNPLTNMMENLIMGDARARQAAEGFIDPMQQANVQQMQMMEQQYAMMQNQSLMAKQFDEMQINTSSGQSNLFNSQQHVNLNDIWDQQANVNPMQANAQANQMPQQTFQQPWMAQQMRMGMMGTPIFQPNQQMVNETKQTMSDAADKVKEKEEEPSVKEATSNMVDVLSNSENPKHRNSKFLKFLNKLNHGGYKLENEQLVKDKEKLAEFKVIEQQRYATDLLQQQERAKIQEMEETKDIETINTDKFKNILEDDEEVTQEKYNELMQEWMKGGAEMQDMNRLMEEWGKTWDEDYQLNMPVDDDKIKFAQENQYLQSDFNRVEHAKILIEENKSQEAILCLEAEVQQHRENSEAWRILGQLFQENDQDNFAIIALKEAHNADPYDLDTLLALGVSCTNENDRTKAYEYLHLWLKYHPDFSHLPGVQDATELEYDLIRREFEEAHLLKPADTQVLLALGVLSFIQTNFELAGAYFLQAIKENPTDHSLWNKYGAAFSQQLKGKEAIEAYQQALDLRPNYARCVINIGLAQNNNADFHGSANSLLNGLLLNPRLDHVRIYLKQAFLQMNRFDLTEKLEHNDLSLFKQEFNLIDPMNLPKPNLERLYSNPLFQQ